MHLVFLEGKSRKKIDIWPQLLYTRHWHKHLYINSYLLWITLANGHYYPWLTAKTLRISGYQTKPPHQKWWNWSLSSVFMNLNLLLPLHFFLHIYWSIIALQWCISSCFITKWISYTYTYVPISFPSCVSLPRPSLSHPPRRSQSTELISLRHTAASH